MVSLWITICFNTYNFFLLVGSLLFFLLIMRPLVLIIANKIILSVLFSELDAPRFQEIIDDKRFVPSLVYRINAALSNGDYQTVVNIATIQMCKQKSSIKVKYYYLCILARVYFELRDFDKLEILFTKFNEYKEIYPSKPFLNSQNTLWNYYGYLLEKNYEKCKLICQKRNSSLKPNRRDTKFNKIQNEFYYAVACYENGEIEVAKVTFKGVVCAAPRMYIAIVSQKYLDAINQDQQPLLTDVEIIPDARYQTYDEKTVLRINRHRITMRIGIIIVVVLLAVSSAFNYIDKKHNSGIGVFESKLNAALIEYYEEATIIEYFNLKKEETNVDSLGLIGIGNRVDLIEIVSNDGNQTFDVLLVEENIDVEKYYCVKSPASSYYIGFSLSTTEFINVESYCVRKFNFNGSEYWLNIDYVEMYPKN